MLISNDAWREGHDYRSEIAHLGQSVAALSGKAIDAAQAAEELGQMSPESSAEDIAPSDDNSEYSDEMSVALTSPYEASTDLVEAFSVMRQQLAEITPQLRDLRAHDPLRMVALAGEIERVSRLVSASQVLIAGAVQQASGVGDLSGQTLASSLGCRNATEVLQRVTKAPGREITARIRLAERTTEDIGFSGEPIPAKAPAVAAALVEGELSLGCATQIVLSLKRGGCYATPRMLANAEQLLVRAATSGLNERVLSGFDLATSDPADLADADLGNGEDDEAKNHYGNCEPDPDPREELGSFGGLALHDDEMRTFCKAIEVRLDQEGPEPNYREYEERRGFRFGRVKDGLVNVSGVLTAETAARLQRLLEPIMSPRHKVTFEPVITAADVNTAQGEDGDGSAGAGGDAQKSTPHDASELEGNRKVDQRSADQKRHDALATVLQMCAKHPDMPTSGGAPVTVLIQVAEEDLRKDRGVGWVHDHEGNLASVPMSDVRHAACAGDVLRTTLDSAGRIVNLGTPSRIFNANQRRAITLRDGGCVIPGCRVPATWCEIHHVKEWQDGGETHTDNGVMVCWYHHRTLDRSGWEIRMSEGVPEIRPPLWIDPYRYWYRTGSTLRRAERALTA